MKKGNGQRNERKDPKKEGKIYNLDQKIIQIQKSTRTTFKLMLPWHDRLRMKFRWYYFWHLKPYANLIHWSILGLYILLVPLILIATITAPPTKLPEIAKAATPPWKWYNPKISANTMTDVWAADATHIWTAGVGGEIDFYNGSNWGIQKMGGEDLVEIDGNSATNVWAVSNTTIWRTTDGINWTQISVPADMISVGDISVQNNTYTWIAGRKTGGPPNYGGVWRWNGSAWEDYSTTINSAVTTIDVNSSGETWMAIGNKFYQLNGSNWIEKGLASGTSFGYNDVVVESSSDVTFVGIKDDLGSIQHWNGSSFSEFNTEEYVTFRSITRPSGSTYMWAAGNRFVYRGTSDNIWTALSVSDFQGISSFDAGGGNYTLYAAGSETRVSGIIAKVEKSTNNGDNWTSLNQALDWNLSTMHGIDFFDADHGWAVDSLGLYVSRVYSYNNITGQWESKGNPAYNVTFVRAVSQSTIFTSGMTTALPPYTYKIYKSTNGGTSFTSQDPCGGNKYVSDIWAQDENNLWAVGGSGMICKTTNGGTNWTSQTSGTSEGLLAVYGIDANHLWAAGTNGTVLYTTNGGTTWNLSDVAEAFDHFYFTAIAAIDQNRVLVSGNADGEASIIESFDGGQNFNSILGHYFLESGAQINDLDLLDQDHVWAVGKDSSGDGVVWRYQVDWDTCTRSWEKQDFILDNVPVHGLLDVEVVDADNLWVSGREGTIARFTGSMSPPGGGNNAVMIVLPGQWFYAGNGVVGNPSTQVKGKPFEVKAYITDCDYNLQTSINGTVNLTLSDGTGLGTFNISSGTGNKTISVNKTGTLNINALMTPGNLQGTSSDFTLRDINRATKIKVSFYSNAGQYPYPQSSFSLGNVIGAPGIAYIYFYDSNNQLISPVEEDYTVNVNFTNSSKIYYSASGAYGPWSSSLSLTIREGQTNASFRYATFAAGAITISDNPNLGMQDATINLNVWDDNINSKPNTLKSSVYSPTKSLRPDGVSFANLTATLKNQWNVPISSKEVIFGARAGDNIIQPTSVSSYDGIATGRISSSINKKETVTISGIDKTDNNLVFATTTIDFDPEASLPADKIVLESSQCSAGGIIAGTPLDLTLTLYDKENKATNNYLGKMRFSSQDRKAKLPADYQFSQLDNGTHAFTKEIILKTSGRQKLTAMDQYDTKLTSLIDCLILPDKLDQKVSKILKDKDELLADGNSKVKIEVKLKDQYDNPLTNKEVALTSTRDEDKIQLARKENSILAKLFKAQAAQFSVTNSDGSLTFEVSSTKEGVSTFTITDLTDNIIFDEHPQVIFKKATTIEKLASFTDQISTKTSNIINQLRQNPTIQTMSKFLFGPISALGLVAGAIGLFSGYILMVPNALNTIYYSLAVSSWAARVRKRRRPWGVVYNSVSKKPISQAIVRLYNAKTKKILETKVTDDMGRFVFSEKPQNFYIEVTKEGYTFPSKFVTGQNDKMYSNLYFGGARSMTANSIIDFAIPLDPMFNSQKQFIKASLIKSGILWSFEKFTDRYALPFMLLGIIFTIPNIILGYGYYYLVIVALYILFFTWYKISRNRKHRLGKVYNTKTSAPIPGAVVRIFDKEYNVLKETQITDYLGHFLFLIKPGKYYLTVEAPGYNFPSKKITVKGYFGSDISVTDKRHSIINLEVPIDPE